MRRRQFLAGTAAGAAAIVGFSRVGLTQGGRAGAQGRGGGRGGRGRGGGPADVGADKLNRISIMSLDFGSMIQLPWQELSESRTLDLFDLPQMYVDTYGVHHVEFQHSHLAEAENDPAFVQKMRATVDGVQSQISQINLEFGQQNVSNTDATLRQEAVDRVQKWVDIAVDLNCPRVMINQSQSNLSEDTLPHAIEALKAMSDYGKGKNVMVAAETRGTSGGGWRMLLRLLEGAGAYSTIDLGNVGAQSQEELHEAMKALHPHTSGNMHIKSRAEWDIGIAVRYAESLGYTGLYSIEVSTHQAVRIVYNTILANL